MKNNHSLEYKKDFALLTELIVSFDPCELIKTGAPDDEYDCLTQLILSFIYDRKSKQEIKELITHEIEHHFGLVIEEKYKDEFNNDLDSFVARLVEQFDNFQLREL